MEAQNTCWITSASGWGSTFHIRMSNWPSSVTIETAKAKVPARRLMGLLQSMLRSRGLTMVDSDQARVEAPTLSRWRVLRPPTYTARGIE